MNNRVITTIRITLIKIIIITISLSFLVVFMATTGAAQSPITEGQDFVPGELVIKFQPQLSGQSVERLLQVEKMTALETAPHGNLVRVQVTPGREAEVIERLRGQSNVDFVTYNYRVRALGQPNDPDYTLQWALNNSGQSGGTPGADIEAAEAWDIYTGGDDITIAVIDTGVDLDHPDLQANIVPGHDFVNDDELADDDNSHGTHVAGIAAAAGDNGVGIAGISWRAKIMPLKMLDANGNGSTFDLAEAIYYAADNGANIINMSLGGTCGSWPDVEAAVSYAVSKGLLLVAASGNLNAAVFCPAALEGVLAVAATTDTDARWVGSNYGDSLDVSAPGDSIYSTINNGGYGYKTGTSMASPHVAGLAALIWSYESTLTAGQLEQFIEDTSDDLGDPGWDFLYGAGRINARRALDVLSFQTSTPELAFIDDNLDSVSITLQITTLKTEAITWTATVSPTVSWLTVTPPTTGTISAASSPTTLTLTATKPPFYGTHTATVRVIGTTDNGTTTGLREEPVQLIYVPQIHYLYVPLLVGE